MATILTRKGQEIIVDDDDFERLNQHKWWLNPDGYAFTTQRLEGKRVNIRMHRLVMGLKPFKLGDTQVVDHINGRTSDNRKENLRVVTRGQNSFNTNNKIYKSNNSGYKGVNFHKGHPNKPWNARIRVRGKRIELGLFHTPEEAYEAYLAAKAKYHTFD